MQDVILVACFWCNSWFQCDENTEAKKNDLKGINVQSSFLWLSAFCVLSSYLFISAQSLAGFPAGDTERDRHIELVNNSYLVCFGVNWIIHSLRVEPDIHRGDVVEEQTQLFERVSPQPQLVTNSSVCEHFRSSFFSTSSVDEFRAVVKWWRCWGWLPYLTSGLEPSEAAQIRRAALINIYESGDSAAAAAPVTDRAASPHADRLVSRLPADWCWDHHRRSVFIQLIIIIHQCRAAYLTSVWTW